MEQMRTWSPSEAEAEQMVRQFFRVVTDDFECIRSRVVGEAVARAFGIRWSPRLARTLRAVIQRMGAGLVCLHNVNVWKGLRPRHFDRADAVKLANAVRGRKRPVTVGAEEAR